MSTAWVVIVVVGVASILFKAAGPVFLGRRDLPPRMVAVVSLIGPVMLTALVVTQTVGGDQEIVLDARLPGGGRRRDRRSARGTRRRRHARRRGRDRDDPARDLAA